MSKLNRSEFKELLTEWKQNFINERSIHSFSGGKEFSGEISDFGKSILKKLNYPVHLVTIPAPQTWRIGGFSNIFHSLPDSSKFVKNYGYVVEKSELNYDLIKEDIIDFCKSASKEEYEEEELGKPDEDGDVWDTKYGDLKFSLPKGHFSKDEIINELEEFFKEIKNIMCGKEGSNLPCLITIHDRHKSNMLNTSSGGLYQISNLSEDTQESFLKWLFSHDHYHVLGDLSRMFDVNNPESYSTQSDEYFHVKGLDDSFLSSDNTASVYSQMLSMSKPEMIEFLENTHTSRENLQNFINNDISLNNQSADDYLINILSDKDEFNKFKKNNIDKVAKNMIENIQPAINELFKLLKNKIIIIPGKVT